MKDDRILPAGESAKNPVSSRTNQPRRILVVDDDGDIRHLNAEALKQSGYQVDTAEDGEAAWTALHVLYASESYDLVITDHDMPRLSGLGLVKKLRAARMATPIIMATGTLPDEFNRDPDLQPAATLIKPYTAAELLGTVKRILWVTDNARSEMGQTPSATPPSSGGVQP